MSSPTPSSTPPSTPSSIDFPTFGKVTAVKDGLITFAPRGTRYVLHLKTAGQYTGPTDSPVAALIRVAARKVYTVPSGGNFITPIMGPPKIIQGRVKYADEQQLVIHAGATFIVSLPTADTAIDLDNGAIAVNTMVNVVALPGGSFELAPAPVVA